MMQEPQDLCVPVRKNAQAIPPESFPFLQYADLKCYRIDGPALNLNVNLSQPEPLGPGYKRLGWRCSWLGQAPEPSGPPQAPLERAPEPSGQP